MPDIIRRCWRGPTEATGNLPARARSDPIIDEAASVPEGKATVGKLVFTVLAAVAVFVILAAAVCLLPENSYQRWRLVDPELADGHTGGAIIKQNVSSRFQ